MSYSIRLYGRIHPEQAAISIPEKRFQLEGPILALQGSRWKLFGHGSQLLITAEFDEDEKPEIAVIKGVAYELASLQTNLLSLATRRVFQVEIVAAGDGETDWVFGADVPDITPKQGYVHTDALYEKLSSRALGALKGLLEDFQHALQQATRSPMYVHRMLESLAWYYAEDNEKQMLSVSNWTTMWQKIGLLESDERRWALDVLQPVATRLRHGRRAQDSLKHHEVLHLAEIVINRFVASEVREDSAKM